MADIIVIGSGIAGLTAALQLKKAGHHVMVLEANAEPGGRMRTRRWHDFDIELGASFVTTRDDLLLNMAVEVGLGDKILRPKKGLTITTLRNSKLHSANFMSVLSYMKWSGVSLKARLAMLRLIPHFLRAGKLDDVYHLENSKGGGDDISVEDFFNTQISAEMFQEWAEPMFEVMCAYGGDDLSKQAFIGLMSSYLGADTLTFEGGLGILTSKLAEALGVRTECRVTKIVEKADGSGVTVFYTDQGRPQVQDAVRVVVAVPGDKVLGLFEHTPPAWLAFFSKVKYSTGALHYFLYEGDFNPGVESVFLPRRLGLPINNISFEGYQNGKSLILTDPSIWSSWSHQTDSTVALNSMDAVGTVFPALKGRAIDNILVRWPSKLPTFKVGYLTALRQFWQNSQENPVFFCGDYFGGPSTGAALATGRECAERLIRSLDN